MALTEAEIKAKLLQSFKDDNVSDDLTNLMADFSSRFLYLEQIIDTNILMEASYTRSKNLNSRITHAADNFYSVPRGNNRRIRLTGLRVSEQLNAEKYDIISTYGEYKLVYANPVTKNVHQPLSLDCYLTLGVETLELQGSGRLYLEVPSKNISEDIIVFDKLTGYEFRLTRNVHDLDLVNTSSSTSSDNLLYDMAVITDNDFSVKLWMNKPFDPSNTYVVKFLKCPDENIPPLDTSRIVNIPKMIKQEDFNIPKESDIPATYPITNLDKIYSYTASFVKTKDIIRTVENLDIEIGKFFTDFKGFKTIIDANSIKIYYVVDYEDPSAEVSSVERDRFSAELKAHYVTQTIEYYPAKAAVSGKILGTSTSVPLNPLDVTLEVQITDEINYDIVKNIVQSYQGKVGEDLNFFQLIADLKSNSEVGGKIKQVILPNNLMNVVELDEADYDGTNGPTRPLFTSLNIVYTFVKK